MAYSRQGASIARRLDQPYSMWRIYQVGGLTGFMRYLYPHKPFIRLVIVSLY